MPGKCRGQQSFEFKTWGGKRKGAGRPPKGRRSSEPHKARIRFSCPTPVHVTLRVAAPIPTLRRPDAYHAIRHSLYAVVGRDDFRIVHLSIERDHLHLLVEADDHVSLWDGLRAFESSAAQRLNRAISLATGTRRRGKVFEDRYHARLITSPAQARNVISYTLNNWRRHGQDRGMETMFWDVDYYSSGPSFEGWAELDGSPFLIPTPDYPRLSVCRPKTWLLKTGWRQAGPISFRAIPGSARRRASRRLSVAGRDDVAPEGGLAAVRLVRLPAHPGNPTIRPIISSSLHLFIPKTKNKLWKNPTLEGTAL